MHIGVSMKLISHVPHVWIQIVSNATPDGQISELKYRSYLLYPHSFSIKPLTYPVSSIKREYRILAMCVLSIDSTAISPSIFV